jgi:formate dehydrogenase major subunit
VWWDDDKGEWTGFDVPDFKKDMRPDYVPPEGATAENALRGDEPFVMQADGKGWLYVPAGLTDGPLPAHYEPHESPFPNVVYGQQANPVRQTVTRRHNRSNPPPGAAGSDRYPYVFTTYRLTEHHTAGGMSRFLPYLSELQPEFFCEVSPALADERHLTNGGWATIITVRAAIEARVMVTERIRSLKVGDRVVHQIGLPYHWGNRGLSTGDSANELLGMFLDPNVHIQEAKAASCDIRPGRRPKGSALTRMVEDHAEHGFRG